MGQASLGTSLSCAVEHLVEVLLAHQKHIFNEYGFFGIVQGGLQSKKPALARTRRAVNEKLVRLDGLGSGNDRNHTLKARRIDGPFCKTKNVFTLRRQVTIDKDRHAAGEKLNGC